MILNKIIMIGIVNITTIIMYNKKTISALTRLDFCHCKISIKYIPVGFRNTRLKKLKLL